MCNENRHSKKGTKDKHEWAKFCQTLKIPIIDEAVKHLPAVDKFLKWSINAP